MKDFVIAQQLGSLQEIVSSAHSLGIIVSENQNMDKMGAALALYLAFKASGKDVQIVSKKDPLVEISNLVGIDKVKKSFDGQAKMLIVSLPYREGEIEKVSYNIEGTRLNINLFAAQNQGITFNEKDVDYVKTGATPQVVFTVGIRNQQELQGFLGEDKEVKTVALDTNPNNQGFADVTLSDSMFSSYAEIAAEVIEGLGLPVDVDVAQNIIDGLSVATNNFTSPNTSPIAFETAAFAMRNGARRRNVQQQQQRPQRQQQQQQQMQQRRDNQQRDNQQNQRMQQQPQFRQNVQPQVPQPPQEEEMSTEPVEEPEQVTDEVPSDWFVPKVFKSSRNQE